MADLPHIDEAETRARWAAFDWNALNRDKAAEIIARYPAGRQASAAMPLLNRLCYDAAKGASV